MRKMSLISLFDPEDDDDGESDGCHGHVDFIDEDMDEPVTSGCIYYGEELES